MKRHHALILRIGLALSLVAVLVVSLFQPQSRASAAAILTVSPLTWNIIGLDSNNVNVGPNNFPVGARVCNTGDTTATNVTASFVWDSADPYINLRPGSLSTLTATSLAAGACTDFYFEVTVTRDAAAYNHTRRYHITATADGLGTVSTPTPRELWVEHLISQNRNTVSNVLYGTTDTNLTPVASGGTMSLIVGNTYFIRLVGATATQGYEQIESFINFPNTVFQVLSVSTAYSADTSPYVSNPSSLLYGDACLWENNPNSPNYRACNAVGKVGGGTEVTYQVRILSVGSSNPQPLSTLLYDFSGSSYHYNSDFGVSTRYAYVFDPSSVTIAKNFSPDPTTAGGVSTLTFTLTNPGSVALSGLNFTDTLPTTPGAMVVASTPSASTTGCGSPTFAPAAGAASLTFSNGSLAPNSTCTIKVNVTVPVTGTYTNTSNHLFIGTLDTGNFATDTLTVNTAPAGPAPVCGLSMAQWSFPTGFNTASPLPNLPSGVTASASPGGGVVSTAFSEGTDSWGSSGGIATTATLTTANNDYLQFVLDTTGFSSVSLTFDAARKNIPNSPRGIAVYYSSGTVNNPEPNAALYSNATALPTGTTAFTSFGSLTFTPTANTMYVRIYFFNAGNTSSGSDIFLDNVSFTGCGVPRPATISKTFSPNPVAVGATSTLTFTVANPNSGFAFTGVRFTDTLPSGLTVPTGSSTQCGGTLSTTAPRTISLTGGALAGGASCTINVTVTTSASGVYDNVSGFVSSTEGGTNTEATGIASASLTVLQPPGMSKLFAPNPILANGTSTLTFTITNPNLNNALNGVAFSDTYPVGLQNAATPNASTTCTSGTVTAAANGGSVSLSGATVAAGSSCTLTVNVTAASAGTYANTSGAVSSTNSGTGNTASNTLTVNAPNPSIALLKQISTSAAGPWTSYVTVNAGSNVYYRFTIENTGDVPFNPVSVTDALVSTAGCSWTAPLPVPVAGNDNHITTCVVGPVAATSGSQTNTARASGTYSGTVYNSGFSSATYATPGLTLVKTATETFFVIPGDVLHYSFAVTNSGFAPLLGPVTVADDKAADESCPALTTVGDLDDFLEPNETVTCTATYTVTAADVTAGFVTNTASATVAGVTSNTDSETVGHLIPDLTVSKSNNVSGSVLENGSFNWTITVTNSGIGTASFANTQVILTDALPGLAAYYPQGALTVTNGGTVPTGTISCSITGTALACAASGPVTFPASASFSVTFAVTPTTAGNLANTASVDPNNNIPEGNETNNSGSDTVTVLAPTPTPTNTATATATSTPTPTATPSPTPTNTATGTPTNTPTTTPTNTATSRPTDTPTNTPTSTPTDTPTATPTNTPTNTATSTATGTATNTPTSTPADTPTTTATNTPTETPTSTPTATATPSPTGTTTPTSTSTNTPTGTPTSTPTSQTAGISGAVFHDLDLDGTQDGGEPGIPAVRVDLYDSTGTTLIASVTTVAGGSYQFNNLPAGNYLVVESDPAGYVSTTPNSVPVTLSAGDSETVDFGEYKLPNTTVSSITGTVFNDANSNGLMDSSEMPLSGVTVQLRNSAGTVIATTTTNASGNYSFPSLPAGTYTVTEIDPAGYISTTLNTVAVTLTGGSTATINFGDQTSGGAQIADPAVTKYGSPSSAAAGSVVIYTITVGNNGTANATNVVLTDTKPAFLNIISITISPNPGLSPVVTGNTFTINFGTVTPADSYIVTVVTRVNAQSPSSGGSNTVSISTTSTTDRGFNNSAAALLQIISSGGNGTNGLPDTGFAPRVVTDLSDIPRETYIQTGGITLEVPSLSINIPIVGVPLRNGTWNVSWLDRQAGWLEGSAFPSWNGNSVLTSHVYLSNGLPGPFVSLSKLKFGDKVIVHAFGQKYVFEVQTNMLVGAKDASVFKHEEKPWLTLLTCKEYDEKTNTYRKRVVVRAVLVKVEWE